MNSSSNLTDEQLTVIHELLLKSPPGELYVVLEEIKDLLSGCSIPTVFIENTLKVFNLTHNVLVDVEGSKKPLLLTGSYDDDSNVYCDVITRKCYEFDHLNNVIIQETRYVESPCHTAILEIKNNLIDEGSNYINKRYNDRSSIFVSVDGDHLDIVIAGELVKLNSFYSGQWVSRYSLDVCGDQIHLAGAVDISSHYFENGNVRMVVHKDMDPQTVVLEGHATAVNVFNHITMFEDRVQEGLQGAFSSIKQDSLKEFRRQLPKTHQHFTWVVNAHKLADSMKEASQ